MSNDRYNYSPSLPAAIIFVVCFSFSSLAHVFQIGRFRSWFFIPFLIGCLIEAVGYGARAFNASEPHGKWSLPPYIIQALLLLLGPPFFAASIYMVLGRLIGLLDAEKYSLISLKWLTKFFLLGDVASIFAQAIGGGKLSGAKTKQDRDQGQLIIIIGLAIQLVFFGFFIIATSIFHWRIRKTPTNKSFNAGVHWEKLLYVLYGASVLIMVRSIFRVAEYILGEDGELMSKEVYLYIFDATLMFLVSIAFNIFHPSRMIKNAKATRVLIRDSESQLNSYAME